MLAGGSRFALVERKKATRSRHVTRYGQNWTANHCAAGI